MSKDGAARPRGRFAVGEEPGGCRVLALSGGPTAVRTRYQARCLRCGSVRALTHKALLLRVERETVGCRRCCWAKRSRRRGRGAVSGLRGGGEGARGGAMDALGWWWPCLTAHGGLGARWEYGGKLGARHATTG